jgi:hypothetical protein
MKPSYPRIASTVAVLSALLGCVEPEGAVGADEGLDSKSDDVGAAVTRLAVFADAVTRALDGALDDADVDALIARARTRAERGALLLVGERFHNLIGAAAMDRMLRASLDPVPAGVPDHRNDPFFVEHKFSSVFRTAADELSPGQLHYFSMDAPTFFGSVSLEVARGELQGTGWVPAQLVLPDGTARAAASFGIGEVFDSSFGPSREFVYSILAFPEGTPPEVVQTPFSDPFAVLVPGFQKGANAFTMKILLDASVPIAIGREIVPTPKYEGNVRRRASSTDGSVTFTVNDRAGQRVATLEVPRVATTPNPPGTPSVLTLRNVSRVGRQRPVVRWTESVTNPDAELSIATPDQIRVSTESIHGQDLARAGFQPSVLATWRDVQLAIE